MVLSQSSMASRRYLPPIEWLTDDGSWPDGPFAADVPSYAVTTAALVERLQSCIDERGLSLRAVAVPAGMDPTSLSRLLTGKVVPDLGTIAGLEQALDVDLWPGRVSPAPHD